MTISLFTYFEEIPIDKSALNEHIASFRVPVAFNTLKISIYLSSFSSTFVAQILEKQEVQPVDEIKSAIFSTITLIKIGTNLAKTFFSNEII